jgi:ABC-type transporter Mla subunit MlaD
MTKRQLLSMTKTIEKHRDNVGKVLDKLDFAISELEALQNSCDSAWESLQQVLDALSEQV